MKPDKIAEVISDELDVRIRPYIDNLYSIGVVSTIDTGIGSPTATAYYAPTTTGSPNNTWTNPTNAYVEDSVGSRPVTAQDYATFGISIPVGATINGIEVRTRGAGTVSPTPQIGVELSWNAGTNYTSTGSLHNHAGNWSYSSGASPNVSSTGTYLWGRVWTADELSDTNLRVKMTNITATLDIDIVEVKVTYTSPSTGFHADVFINGSATVIPNIPTIDGYVPSVGDKVLILNMGRSGANMLILGSIGLSTEWIAPTLLNSWVNYAVGIYPSAGYYRNSMGEVKLQGLLKNGTIGQALFVLPVGYRPLYQLHIAIASNGAFGNIAIQPNGNVLIQVGSNGWASLDAISFKAEQ